MTSLTVLCLALLAIGCAMAQHHYEHHGFVDFGHEHGHGDEHHGEEDFFAPAGYRFEYGVHDPHSHDKKSQHEHRDHDDVKGAYTIHDPDGTKRVVEYTSGKHDGFQAVVKRIGVAQHPAVYGKHGGHGQGHGGTSYVGITHWGHGSGK